MKNHLKVLFQLLLVILLAACTARNSQGPSAWIDQPLEKDNPHPMALVYITAHASSDNGVARFDFYIDEKLLVSVSAANCALCDASTQWDPPAAGIYHVRVQAVDGNGNKGDFAQSIVRISGEALAQEDIITTTPHDLIEMIPEIATWTPTPAIRTTTTITTTAPTGLTIQAGSNANCRSGPGTTYDIDDGLPKGVTASIEGRSQDSQWVWIRKPSGGSGHCWVAANIGPINGDLNKAPVVNAPPPHQIITITVPPPPISVDSTPPDISDLSAVPSMISAQKQCGDTPSTVVIQARVTDAGGIARVYARIPGEGEFDMTPIGEGYYQVTPGPFAAAGTLTIFVQASDNAGNSAVSPSLEVQVVACLG